MTPEQRQEFMQRLRRLEEDMKSSGVWFFSGRLHKPETATVISVKEGEVVTTDGPFIESKEYIAGFYIIEAKDLDDALHWGARVTKCINNAIEVRPFWTPPGT